MELAIDTSTHDSCTILRLSGDIDIQTAPQLRDRLGEFRGQTGAVVVDLADVEFLDSSGLGALVGAATALQEAGGSLRLACPRPHVQKVFRISRIADVIPIHESVDEACAQ